MQKRETESRSNKTPPPPPHYPNKTFHKLNKWLWHCRDCSLIPPLFSLREQGGKCLDGGQDIRTQWLAARSQHFLGRGESHKTHFLFLPEASAAAFFLTWQQSSGGGGVLSTYSKSFPRSALSILIRRHLRLTPKPNRNRPFKGVSCEGLGGKKRKIFIQWFLFKPLKKLNEQTLFVFMPEWTEQTDLKGKMNISGFVLPR